MMRSILTVTTLLLSASWSQAGLVGNFPFSESSGSSTADTSPTGATGILGSGAALTGTGKTTYDGTINAYVAVPAPGDNWDGVYWSSAPNFQLTWELTDVVTTQVSGKNNGVGLLTFTDAADAAGNTQQPGNRILGIRPDGKVFVAASGVQPNSLAQATTAYTSTTAINDGQPHDIKAVWNIAAGGTAAVPLQNDSVDIYIDGNLEVTVPNFDFNTAEMQVPIAGFDDPGMLIGKNFNGAAWDALNGSISNVEINLSIVPEPSSLGLLGLGGWFLIASAIKRRKR